MQSNDKNKKRLIIISVIIILAMSGLFSVLIVMTHDASEYNLIAIEEEVIKKYGQAHQTILYGFQTLADNYFDEVSSNIDIMNALYIAAITSKDNQEGQRTKLWDLSQDIYLKASADNFSELNFLLPDKTGFLSIKDNRSIEYEPIHENVESDGHKEIYKTYDGYLYRYPLVFNDELAGYFEIKFSYSTVTKLMSSLYNIESAFIISKPIINDALSYDSAESEYLDLSFTDEYYLDRESFSRPESFDASNENVFEELVHDDIFWDNIELMSINETFFITISYEESDYSVVFQWDEITDKNTGGYFIFIDEDNYYYTLRLMTIYQYAALIFMWLLISAIVLILLFNRYRISKITFFDKLTGAYNRNKLFDLIEAEIKKNTKLSLLLVDVDKFKSVNDTYGHLIGDEILKKITQLFLSNIRSTDMVFRYGGDEFIILLPNTSLEAAKHVALKINEVISTINWENIDDTVTLSIGVAEYNHNEDIDQLINRSDSMLYKAKEYGRNCVFADSGN